MRKLVRVITVVLMGYLLMASFIFAGIACDYSEKDSFVQKETVSEVYRFINGLWFDGKSFEPRTVYSVNGIFRMKYEGKPDSTIDLKGRFIIPPFAEAHNHHFMQGMDYNEQIASYFAQGIFYAKNPNSLKRLTDPISSLFNKPSGIDVIYSNGGITATGGHPVQIYDHIAQQAGWKKEDMENQAYFIVDTEADLDAKWERIKADKPDFIKVYLEYSEEYEARKDDPKFYGLKGLNPRLLPRIVEKAHRADLRVSVHVNTSIDFHNAVMAGVDEIAHLPLARIADKDAEQAAARKTVVVTTTLSHRRTDHVTGLEDIHRHNLRLLRESGVILAIGTDDNNRTVLDEAENLHRSKVFDNLTLLKMWTETTSRVIFPGRKIGYLKDGHEASFLALDGNPVENFENVKKINFRFKQGQVIEATKTQSEKKKQTGHPSPK